MGKRQKKTVGKRLLSLVMALAMVLTTAQLSGAEKVLAADGEVKLYFELPAGTSAGDWAANAWKNQEVVVSGGDNVRVGGTWGDQYKPSLQQAQQDGWGYVTVSGTVQGLQFVQWVKDSADTTTSPTVYGDCWNTQISKGNHAEAYYSPADNKWYTTAEKTTEIEEEAITEWTNVKLYFLNSGNWEKPAINVWENVTTTAGDRIEINGWNGGTAPAMISDEGGWYYATLEAKEKGFINGLQFLNAETGKEIKLDGTNELLAEINSKKTGENGTPISLYYAYGKIWDSKESVVEPTEEVADPATWTGDFTGLTFKNAGDGISSWDPADTDGDLNYVGKGVYARTFCFDELTENVTVQYKVAFKHGWNNGEIGENGQNVALEIPAGATAVTIVCDKEKGQLFSGIAMKAAEGEQGVTLIGTIRGFGSTDKDWGPNYEGTEFDFTRFSKNVYVFQMNVAQGSWEYKIIRNPGNAWLDGGNKSIEVTADEGKLVTFVYDAENKALYDSVNDLAKVNELLASKTQEEPAEDGVKNNANGTLTFTAVAESGKQVELVYGEQSEVENGTAKTVVLSPASEGASAYKSAELYLGDAALDLVYNYKINGTFKDLSGDGVVEIAGVKYQKYHKDAFTGRKLTVPGTLVDNGGTKTWDPSINVMNYIGNGLYEFTFHQVAPANYEYKIATGTWNENYGAGGVKDGPNIAVTVPKEQDVTVWYSDFSHFSRCSLNYTFGASMELKGTGIPAGTKFGDSRLTGVYSAVVPKMAEGTYHDTKIVLADKTEISFAAYEVKEQKDVTFYYDPESEVYYSDASDQKVDTTKLRFDSKNIEMKAPFGAVATGKDVTYTIETGLDVTDVRLVIKGAAKKNIPMTKKDGAAEGKQLWTATTSFDKIGEYKYFFAVYSGTAAVMYGDDDGNYGEGKATDLLNLLPYDQIVYVDGFKTPDWMKNAVIYQIFPDRFYNGNISNDTITTDARGNVKYEYIRDWYMLPENPEQESKNPDDYPVYAYKGDGNWSNEIYGGDLKGITKRIDYLKALGVTVIYMNPVFESISSHRYDTSDYKNIDPILGTLGDFEELVRVADENGMKIVLDGVFNHVSDDSVYFDRYYEYLEAGTDTIGAYPYWAYVYDYMADKSVDQAAAEAAAKEYFSKNYGIKNFDYVEWFDVFRTTLKGDDGKEVSDSYGLRAGKPVYGYDGWWGYDSMPIIKSTNGSEYQTGTWAQDIIGKNETSTTADNSVTQYWLSKGMDGWRLDVANEVSDETWQHFRKSVKALSSDNVIIGEIWTDAVGYLMGDMYDSVMNYMFRGAVIDFVKDGDSIEAMNTLERLRERYPKEAFYAMMNLVDSHDTTRILSYLDGIDDDRNQKDVGSAFPTYEKTSETAKQMQYLVAMMQFTYAGAPTVYYGDELGMVGADDPDDRRAMIWGKGNQNLVEWYATLAAIRSNYTALRTGTVEPVYVSDEKGNDSKNILSYVRRDNENALLVMLNNADRAVPAAVTASAIDANVTKVTDLVSGDSYDVVDGMLNVSVPAYRGLILVASDQAKAATINADALKPGYEKEYIVPVIPENSGSGNSGSGNSSSGNSSSGSGSTGTSSGDTTKKPENDNTKVEKNPDGTTTETKTETTTNAAGKEVNVTVTTEKDADGKVTGSKEVSVIKEAAKDTSATVTVKKDADGNITAAKANVAVKGSGSAKKITGTLSGAVVSQITDAAATKDVTVSVKISSGSKSYTVKADADELTAGAKLKVVAIDPNTKNYVLVNATTYKVSKDGNVKVALPAGETYELVTPKEAAAIEKKILQTVKVQKSSATVKKGKSTTVKLSSKLDMDNVSKITYVSSKKSVATVSKTGKITAKKAGTVTVKAKVTLKNGTTKTVTMKIKVKK